jgi:hypothetical protein
MSLFRPLPDQPCIELDGPDDPVADAFEAWLEGATLPELHEYRRTGVLTLSMRARWWWRRTRPVLR